VEGRNTGQYMLEMTKIRSNPVHTDQYAGSVPSDHNQGQAVAWWNHCRSLESSDISSSFFTRLLKKGAVDLPDTLVVSIATSWKW